MFSREIFLQIFNTCTHRTLKSARQTCVDMWRELATWTHTHGGKCKIPVKYLPATLLTRRKFTVINRILWLRDHAKLSEYFLLQYAHNLDFEAICISQNIPENTLCKLMDSDKIDMIYVYKTQPLTEKFLRQYDYKLDWKVVCKYQMISEDFMRDYSEKIDWYRISKIRDLSVNFIWDFTHKLRWTKNIECQINVRFPPKIVHDLKIWMTKFVDNNIAFRTYFEDIKRRNVVIRY